MTECWKSKTFNIAEWYGRDFLSLAPGKIGELARIDSPKSMICPFSSGPCNKKGGVCSIRAYGENDAGKWMAADDELVATCPRRFQDAGMVIRWVGETLIAEGNPKVVVEVPFLEGIAHDGEPTGATVGKIDMVLTTEKRKSFDWCAVEIQSVYFAWFVVRFERGRERFRLVEDSVHFTTLARAVEGLTAGKPVALSKFEKDIAAKLDR